uniref:Uncharacterized protein n=1 Tax=Ailuropoda melanoleuca TaxID=9646 RepID=A0A7N5KKI1_AILME
MRNNYNKLHLPMTNRSKISNHLLFCQPHSPSCCSSSYPNTMKLYRSNSSNNCPQTDILHVILYSKLQL